MRRQLVVRPGPLGTEAARLLRQGEKLAFHTTTILVTVCSPGPDGPAGQELLHPQRQAHRLATPRGGFQFHPGHDEWINILRESGFIIDALHELHAPPDAPIIRTTHWRAPTGFGSGQVRKSGLPTSATDPP